MTRQRVNPRRLSQAPIVTRPEPNDNRLAHRQLDFGDIGSVRQLNPPLPGAVHRALLDTSTPAFCSVTWCDEPPTAISGRCAVHHVAMVGELSATLARDRARAQLRFPRRLRPR